MPDHAGEIIALIPAYNEVRYIADVVKRTLAAPSGGGDRRRFEGRHGRRRGAGGGQSRCPQDATRAKARR